MVEVGPEGTLASVMIRGATAPGTGHGACAPQGSASSSGMAGVAIMGTEAKRAREEGEASTKESLSKHLRPAPLAAAATATTGDGSAGAATTGSNTGGKSIILQRNRVQPS